MAPLIGSTLGERQQYYNQLVKEAIGNKKGNLLSINFEEDDVDNMIKIDIACLERNVVYILDVYRCEDMLYVSRAIKKSTWLITDPQYAHIINPKYLHSKIFPQMNAKAVTKLMLHIRRHLRDEDRVKAFYNYVNKISPNTALQWLGNCSLEFIETIVAARADVIPVKLLKRLCRKSINILRVWMRSQNVWPDKVYDVYTQAKYFLKNPDTAKEYLDIKPDLTVKFYNDKYTNILMKQCPDRIKDNLWTYYTNIELSTFVKYIKTDEIGSFLIKTSADVKRFDFLSPFLEKMPREEVFDFLKELYQVNLENFDDTDKSDYEALFYAIEGGEYKMFSSIYQWYRFAPFQIAFRDIKKFIFAESSPEERHSMLVILLTCASIDFKYVKIVLQYYHDKHINEPYLHKITFVNSLISQHDTFRFDDGTWNILNRLYHSLEVYIESGNRVQHCLVSIILYDVLRDLPVHEVVEEKLQITTLIDVKHKLNAQEQDKVFNYLYNLSVTKLCSQSTNSETGMHEAIKLLKNIWNLLKVWNKVETHHRFVIDKIAEFGDIKKASQWIAASQTGRRKRKRKHRMDYDAWKVINPEPYVNIPSVYKMVKTYRKHLFENSFILHPSEEVCLHALKHDPTMLTRYKTELDGLRSNDEISLKKFLSKLRVYWSDSLATEWTDMNIKCIQKCTGLRAILRGILTLLPRNKLLNYIKINVPDDNKMHWSEINETKLSVQKHIAKHMHIARPQLPAEVVLWYAKGDYLQYALLSLNSMYYNLRSSDLRKYITIMLSSPVSLQKHGIRLLFDKYKTAEIINTSPKIWNNTRNRTIRAKLFTSIFKLLCKEKKLTTIKALWSILSAFMDDLNHNENKVIYHNFRNICDVPVVVIGQCYQKTYLFLKTMPPKSDLDHILHQVTDYAAQYMEYLDNDFVENSLLDSIYDKLSNRQSGIDYLKIISAYLLCSKDLTIQTQKYNNVMKPVIDQCLPKWIGGEKHLLDVFQHLLSCICCDIPHYVIEKKMTMPVEILASIYDVFNVSFCIKEHYALLRRWLMTTKYLYKLQYRIKAYDELSEPYTWESVRTKTTEDLAIISANLLSRDLNETFLFTTIYLVFEDAFQQVLNDFGVESIDLLRLLDKMLDSASHPSMYLLVLNMIPKYGWDGEFIKRKESIKRKIYLYKSDEVTVQYFHRYEEKYSDTGDDMHYYESDDDNEDDDDNHNHCSKTSVSIWSRVWRLFTFGVVV